MVKWEVRIEVVGPEAGIALMGQLMQLPHPELIKEIIVKAKED